MLEPTILTIFGVTGDLSKRKLLPALYHLAHDKLLPPTFKIVGISRRGTTVDDVLSQMKLSVEARGDECAQSTLDNLKSYITIIDMEITKPEDYAKLKKAMDDIEDTLGVCANRLFYLAIPSTLFEPVVGMLGDEGLNENCQHGKADSRLMIEKPFGYDLQSAKSLIDKISESFSEEQVYRIDHYLAKETVQNILTFRFENPLFSGNWNNRHISHIMLTATESIGIENRVSFYEQTGALRDLIQSHLLQLLALVTMDVPATMRSKDIHASKESLFADIITPRPDEMAIKTVRAQYESYKKDVNNYHSLTETFAAIELDINDDRWKGVPMFIRTGKALKEKVSEITIVFQDPNDKNNCQNYLTIRLQPNEGIVLDLRIKKPGFAKEIQHVTMDFCYPDTSDVTHPDAYERVIIDAIKGDKTLFATAKEVLESWRIIDPILQAWQNDQVDMLTYTNGSWGPEQSDALINRAGGNWLTDELKVCTFHTPLVKHDNETKE